VTDVRLRHLTSQYKATITAFERAREGYKKRLTTTRLEWLQDRLAELSVLGLELTALIRSTTEMAEAERLDLGTGGSSEPDHQDDPGATPVA